jgi:hypothetical protein
MRGEHNRWKLRHGTSIRNVKMMLADAQRIRRSALVCWIRLS